MDMQKEALAKLKAEKKTAKCDRYGNAMKGAVCEALELFCRQDGEFAQAVVQGGTFEDCMKAVAKNFGNAILIWRRFTGQYSFISPALM